MRRQCRWSCIIFAFCSLASSAQDLTPEQLLIAKIKMKMEDTLHGLPNYTCTETIERSRRRPPAKRFELQDVIRLEVGLVRGKELYALPGSYNFEEKTIEEFVNEGAISNGNFAIP